MKGENIPLAILLAKNGGMHGTMSTSTASLAGQASFSQQSVSRKLRELEADGVISRRASNAGMEVSFTEKGRRELESLYLELRGLFSGKGKASLHGTVVDGHGEGSYYTSLPGYNNQFRAILGKGLFPGTLNLRVDNSQRNSFTACAPVQVNGFVTKERTFGGIDCWPCTVNGKVGALAILPHRTNHPGNVIEVVASSGLRKALGLRNGSEVRLSRE
ncbi:MAG: CTP-dependent riboflavin kinase [Candidatus Diapherotrites archaeon]|uniref:Riboflavin kinase n=1 Tax=Candidatus Iainarchaeum sp. TaxID=3101447 RepID=A0A8T3YKH4_9ARCH|nr:CTP-dependent riboflavin kinase [Candidatus Diapherotrites archaeon]